MHQKNMDFSKGRELSGSVTDVNIVCSLDVCEDLDKPVPGGISEVSNKCVDLNVEGPSSSPRIKEELGCSSSTSDAAC